jgi:hypothetical protein
VASDPRAFVSVPFAAQSEALFWRALLPLYGTGDDEVVVAISQALAPHLRTSEALGAMLDIAPEQAGRLLRSTDCVSADGPLRIESINRGAIEDWLEANAPAKPTTEATSGGMTP